MTQKEIEQYRRAYTSYRCAEHDYFLAQRDSNASILYLTPMQARKMIAREDKLKKQAQKAERNYLAICRRFNIQPGTEI